MALTNTAALAPSTRKVVDAQAVAADNATSAVFEIPNDAAEIALHVEAINGAGTTPTLVAALQTTVDGGVKWIYTGNAAGGFTTGTSLVTLKFTRLRASAQAAGAFSADPPAAGAASASVNGSIQRKCRILFRLGGTASPSYTVNIWLETAPAA